MILLLKWFLVSVCLMASLFAEWDPALLDAYNTSYLADDKYIGLKLQVAEALKNSWCSIEKIDLLMDLTLLIQPKVCVEVGVFSGSSVLPVAATLKHLNSGKVFAIDAWSNQEAVKFLDNDDPNRVWWSEVNMKAIHQQFKTLIKKWALQRFCKKIQKPSEIAVKDVPDGIDFLHLDGDYSEIGALRDVELYLPKVKTGGYVLLSNFYIMVKREQPKIKAFCSICESCEVVATIERDNAILFRKN